MSTPAAVPPQRLSHALDEGHFINLFQRGDPVSNLVEGGLAQESHSLVAGGTADFGGWLLGQDQLTDTVAQVQQFMNRAAASEPGTCALNAPLSFVERNFRPLLGIESAGLQHLRWIVNLGAAGIANHSHQALRQNAIERRNKIVGLYPHVEEAADDVNHVVGVDSCKHQVSWQRRGDSELPRFLCSY